MVASVVTVPATPISVCAERTGRGEQRRRGGAKCVELLGGGRIRAQMPLRHADAAEREADLSVEPEASPSDELGAAAADVAQQRAGPWPGSRT